MAETVQNSQGQNDLGIEFDNSLVENPQTPSAPAPAAKFDAAEQAFFKQGDEGKYAQEQDFSDLPQARQMGGRGFDAEGNHIAPGADGKLQLDTQGNPEWPEQGSAVEREFNARNDIQKQGDPEVPQPMSLTELDASLGESTPPSPMQQRIDAMNITDETTQENLEAAAKKLGVPVTSAAASVAADNEEYLAQEAEAKKSTAVAADAPAPAAEAQEAEKQPEKAADRFERLGAELFGKGGAEGEEQEGGGWKDTALNVLAAPLSIPLGVVASVAMVPVSAVAEVGGLVGKGASYAADLLASVTDLGAKAVGAIAQIGDFLASGVEMIAEKISDSRDGEGFIAGAANLVGKAAHLVASGAEKVHDGTDWVQEKMANAHEHTQHLRDGVDSMNDHIGKSSDALHALALGNTAKAIKLNSKLREDGQEAAAEDAPEGVAAEAKAEEKSGPTVEEKAAAKTLGISASDPLAKEFAASERELNGEIPAEKSAAPEEITQEERATAAKTLGVKANDPLVEEYVLSEREVAAATSVETVKMATAETQEMSAPAATVAEISAAAPREESLAMSREEELASLSQQSQAFQTQAFHEKTEPLELESTVQPAPAQAEMSHLEKAVFVGDHPESKAEDPRLAELEKGWDDAPAPTQVENKEPQPESAVNVWSDPQKGMHDKTGRHFNDLEAEISDAGIGLKGAEHSDVDSTSRNYGGAKQREAGSAIGQA